LTKTSPSGRAEQWSYDAANRVVAAVDGANNTSQYTYDPAGNLKTVALPRGGVYTFTYDTADRMTQRQDPRGQSTLFGYDGENRPTSTTYPSGRVVTTAYDDAGRATSTTAGTVQRTFGYDDAGRLTSAAGGGTTLGFGFDTRGLLMRSTDSRGDTTYSYDAAHRLTSRTPPSGPATTYTYDTSRGLLATVRGAANIDYTAYDGAGQLLRKSWTSPASAATETRTYDPNGHLTSIDGPAYQVSLTFNADSEIAATTSSANPTAATPVTTYTYDDAGRLTSDTKIQNGATTSTTAYTWDPNGNRTTITRDSAPAVTADYDAADRLTSTSDGATYTYDDDGHLITQQRAGTTTGFGYNTYGELSETTAGDITATYSRDGLGRLTSRTDGADTRTLHYEDGTSAPATSQAGTSVTNLVRTPGGELIGTTDTASRQQAALTFHGDLAALRDDTTGQATWSAEYDPFGTTTATTGSTPIALGYQAMPTDELTGMVDMGFRSYDPATGRFTAADDIIGNLAAPISLNRYLYANGSPLSYFDADGHSAWDWVRSAWNSFTSGLSNAWNDAKSAWNSFTSSVSGAWNSFTGSISRGISSFTHSAVFDSLANSVANSFNNAARMVSQAWDHAVTVASNTFKSAGEAIQKYGPTVAATVAGVAVGVVTFLGCEAVTAGIGSVGCMALAGAAGGAVSGAMLCPEGGSTLQCAGIGAASGAVAGATFGLASGAGVGLFAAGAFSGVAGDLTTQVLSGRALSEGIDFRELAVAGIAGGVLSWAGGKLAGKLGGRNEVAGRTPGGGRPGASEAVPEYSTPRTPSLQQKVNPTGSIKNCGAVACEADAVLAGAKQAEAAPARFPALSREDMAKYVGNGTKFERTDGLADLVNTVKSWGNGARAIVGGWPAEYGTTGHYFNVVNNSGKIVFLDFQRGQAFHVADWGRYYLLRTN